MASRALPKPFKDIARETGFPRSATTLRWPSLPASSALIKSLPAAICFYTDGVKLVVEGSAFLERLSQIEKAGVRLIICSTCLNYFGLTEKVRVGFVGGMPDIIEAQTKASKVITL